MGIFRASTDPSHLMMRVVALKLKVIFLTITSSLSTRFLDSQKFRTLLIRTYCSSDWILDYYGACQPRVCRADEEPDLQNVQAAQGTH